NAEDFFVFVLALLELHFDDFMNTTGFVEIAGDDEFHGSILQTGSHVGPQTLSGDLNDRKSMAWIRAVELRSMKPQTDMRLPYPNEPSIENIEQFSPGVKSWACLSARAVLPVRVRGTGR